MKIGKHIDTVKTEYQMLKDFDGNGLCKVYEADTDNGVLLIERIIPGTQLRDEPDLDSRLNEFCRVYMKLHKPPADMTKYPTYMDWVSNITTYMQTRSDYQILCEKMLKAREVCRSMWEKYTGKMLLHGDLHHDNILMGKDGYLAIDPKGVIGDPVFDISRFILNERDWNKASNFAHIITSISNNLNVLEQDIRALFYIELTMAACWSVEDGDYQDVHIDEVLFAEHMMKQSLI